MSFKKILTIIYLIVISVITIATSKVRRGAKPELRLTNYKVTTNCMEGFEEFYIRVNRDVIVDQFLDSESMIVKQGLSFLDLGFSYTNHMIGFDEEEGSPNKCRVLDQSSTINNTYDDTLIDYWYADPGRFTSSLYLCEMDAGNCTTRFTELNAGPFIEVIHESEEASQAKF